MLFEKYHEFKSNRIINTNMGLFIVTDITLQRIFFFNDDNAKIDPTKIHKIRMLISISIEEDAGNYCFIFNKI